MIAPSIARIADKQGWNNETLLALLSDWIVESDGLDAAVNFLENAAFEENDSLAPY